MQQLAPQRPYDGGMHVDAFPHALGCGIIIRSEQPVDAALHRHIAQFLEEYERVLSRFRGDSLVARMARPTRRDLIELAGMENSGVGFSGTELSDAGRSCMGTSGKANDDTSADGKPTFAFNFPAWTEGLFALYDLLFAATAGAIDPCVGSALTRLGYGPQLGRQFREGDAATPSTEFAPPQTSETSWDELAARQLRERAVWGRDVKVLSLSASSTDKPSAAPSTTLVTHGPVQLDFGAAGKGYAVDLLFNKLRSADLQGPLIIDAGGDLRIDLRDTAHVERPATAHAGRPTTAHEAGPTGNRTALPPLRIALEDPHANDQAIGIAQITCGSLCASSPARRHWQATAPTEAANEVHHLLNALNGEPANGIAASWTYVDASHQSPFDTYPTALADGLATALFVTEPNQLRRAFAFEAAAMRPDRSAWHSRNFPGQLFIAQSQ